MAGNRIKKKSKWTTFPPGARNTIPAFRQTRQTSALIGGCLRTKGNWYLKKKKIFWKPTQQMVFSWAPREVGEEGVGEDVGITQLPPGYRWLRSDKDGHRGLTSHPRISQRAITPCGGYLDRAADRFQPAAAVRHSQVWGLYSKQAKREAREWGGIGRSHGKV